MAQASAYKRTDDEPRAFSDQEVRQRHSREVIRAWREEALRHHQRWFQVMNNPYGRD